MSKYRHWWRQTVVTAIRQYPALKDAQREAERQSVTASYSGMPRSTDVGRSTENAALRGLTAQEQNIVDAVEKAIEITKRCRDGALVMSVVNMVDFQKRYTVQGAALKLNVSIKTLWQKRTRFIDCVGKQMGYM